MYIEYICKIYYPKKEWKKIGEELSKIRQRIWGMCSNGTKTAL